MDGVLNFRKPAGPTSHDVVDDIRRIFGQRRVGHAGTLDPMATGVLVVCLGKATRVVEFLMHAPKEYRARMVLGKSTDTQDAAGRIIEMTDASRVTREALEYVARGFVGDIEQVPPMTSALKRDGRRLYELARRGETVERRARKVTVHALEIADFAPSEFPTAEILVRCSSGTYIRTLCADIGGRLGCGAHVSALERTAVGRFTLTDSLTLEELQEAKSQDSLDSVVSSMNEALADLRGVAVADCDLPRVLNGLDVASDGAGEIGERVRMLGPGGRLIAIGVVLPSSGGPVVKPRKVLEGQQHARSECPPSS